MLHIKRPVNTRYPDNPDYRKYLDYTFEDCMAELEDTLGKEQISKLEKLNSEILSNESLSSYRDNNDYASSIVHYALYHYYWLYGDEITE